MKVVHYLVLYHEVMRWMTKRELRIEEKKGQPNPNSQNSCYFHPYKSSDVFYGRSNGVN